MKPFPDRLRLLVVTCIAGLALAGCGGDDDAPPPPAIVAAADTLTLASGASANLLANDTLGGAAATTGASGNVTFTLTSTAPAGVTVTNGVVAIGAAAVPGAVTLNYTICQVGNAGNCASATATVTVPTPAIVANADTFTLAVGGSGDLLANDTLGGAPATAANVSVSLVTTPVNGITISDAGLVTAGAAAVGSTSTITYRICQKVAPTNCANATATVIALGAAAISGRVVDSATGLALGGVRVEAGGRSTTTDPTGAYLLQNVTESTRTPVRFTLADYAETTRITSVSGTANTDVQARMVRVASRGTIAIDTGGTVLVADSPATVTITAGSLQRADGSLPTGNVVAFVTPISPAVDTAQMPGDFTTLDAGTVRPIESFGALDVTFVDNANNPLNLRAGQTATIRIPLATRHPNPPATVPLFWFNATTGRWVQEGTATLGGSGAARYYEGSVSHFTTWNADQIYNAVNVFGCVSDAAGNRIANATVVSDGVNYSGTSSAVTDNNGNFTLLLKSSSTATVTGISNGRLTNTLRLDTETFDRTIPNCLALGNVGAGVTMKLTWGALPTDLDAHLYTPSGDHIYFANKGSLTSAPYANVDVDDVSSFGPEVVTITRLMVGTYRYSVNNFSGQSNGTLRASSARVELNVPGRTLELFTPPSTGETNATNWWNLFEFDVDMSCTVTIRRIGAFATAPPAGVPPAGTVPSYCTPP